jgi:3-dehydroquinate dehydratase/shikimate dehydrogenase
MAIVVSHIASDFDALARQALRQVPLSDLIELRLDRIGNPGEDKLRALFRELKKPVIVTVHGDEAHGSFTGDVDERFDILKTAARAGASFFDVDWSLSLDLPITDDKRVWGKCHRIVSRHEVEGTPDDIAAMDEEVRAVMGEGDAIKLVAHARSTEDGLRMLRHLRSARGGLIAFSSGEAGSFTRVLCRIFGSAFTYAAPAVIPGERAPEATAPGQIRVNDLRGLFPPGGCSAQTAVFGVVGDSVRHSLSPRIHDMALKIARLDAVYLAFETRDLAQFLALADDQNFRGFSVTAPHKQAAFKAAHTRDEASHAIHASNTLVRDPKGWRAYNTDVPAVRDTLERGFKYHRERGGKPFASMGGALAGAHVLVLGAGGAARAVVHASQAAGARATIAARDAKKGAAVAAELKCASIPWDSIPQAAYDVLVNVTPIGGGETVGRSPIPAEWIRADTLVLDAVYKPLKTALLAAAQQRGCTVVPGAEWFVRQAHAQFKLFTSTDADEVSMRKAFEHALA